MADLISRAAAIAEMMQMVKAHEHEIFRGELLHYTGIKAMLECLPAVDAVPVVHGRWISKSEEGIYGPTYCSICDFELRIDDMPYCPMCGAKMDEEARA